MATLSGQKTVTAAGSEVQLAPSQLINGPVMVKALPGNTGIMYVGNVNGGVSSSTGIPLSAGEAMIFAFVGNLAEIWVDASVNGEGVAWCALNC